MADKAPTSPASSEPKAPAPVESGPDAVTKPATDAKPESKPDVVPASGDSVPAKPVSTDSSAAPVTQPAKPASPDSSAAPTAQPAKPASADSAASPSAAAAKPVTAETDKPQSEPAPTAAPVSPTSPTEKRDISEDPTLPGKPTASAGTTKEVEPPREAVDKDDTIPPQGAAAKVTQRFNEPGPAGQAGAGVICPSCGHRNRPGTLMCDNCGTNLVGGVKSAVGTRDLVSATEAAAATSEPLMDVTQLNAVESAGGSVFSDDMVLRIEIEGGATPMLVYPKQEIILGRRDPNTGTLPDVDMTAYSGYRMGVSRTHASIHLQDKQLNLSDRGSSNGTFLNGTRLVAHRPYPVKDGDEIRLGQMVLKVYFQSNKPRK